MFCNICGSQLIDGAVFCQKCGAKVSQEANMQYQSNTSFVNETTDRQSDESLRNEETIADKLDMTLVNVGPYKVSVIRTIRDWMGLHLMEAKDLVEKTPVLLKKGVTQKEAESLKAAFMKAGATVAFTDQYGNSIDVTIHCKSCGAVLDDVKDSCKFCGGSPVITPSYKAKPIWDQLNNIGDSNCQDREEFRKKLFDTIKETTKEKIDDFMIRPTGGKVFVAIFVGFPVLLCVLMLVALLNIMFSNIILTIFIIAGGYIVYQLRIARWVTMIIYDALSKELFLPEEMNAQTLAEMLNGNFDYPYLKNVRYIDDECLIEGRYSVYTVVFNNNKIAELDCDVDEDNKMYRTILWEAMTIRSYLNRYFAPSLPNDAEKDFKALKLVEIQQKTVAVVSIVVPLLATVAIVLAVIEYNAPGSISGIFSPGYEVRNAYLSQYSEDVTIEEAFDNYFANPKWSKYKDGNYSYVVFSGSCEYIGEKADVKIIFKITGENFIVDSLDVNGRTQNDLILYALLASIYSDLEEE